uniref:Putative ovule protein n=1 Tax=Solanum chacoense TaxID=4108 RepID=A0A0V0GGV0_SOLCH
MLLGFSKKALRLDDLATFLKSLSNLNGMLFTIRRKVELFDVTKAILQSKKAGINHKITLHG